MSAAAQRRCWWMACNFVDQTGPLSEQPLAECSCSCIARARSRNALFTRYCAVTAEHFGKVDMRTRRAVSNDSVQLLDILSD